MHPSSPKPISLNPLISPIFIKSINNLNKAQT